MTINYLFVKRILLFIFFIEVRKQQRIGTSKLECNFAHEHVLKQACIKIVNTPANIGLHAFKHV